MRVIQVRKEEDNGATGPKGPPGRDGLDGVDGVDGKDASIKDQWQGPYVPYDRDYKRGDMVTDMGGAYICTRDHTSSPGTAPEVPGNQSAWDAFSRRGMAGMSGETGPPRTWETLEGKPSTFPPSEHTHDYLETSKLRTKRVSTGSIAAQANGDITVTWDTPFADTNYTAQAVVVHSDSQVIDGLEARRILSVATDSIVVRVRNNDALSAHTGTIHAIAIAD